jgi:hypothetical protein
MFVVFIQFANTSPGCFQVLASSGSIDGGSVLGQ